MFRSNGNFDEKNKNTFKNVVSLKQNKKHTLPVLYTRFGLQSKVHKAKGINVH
jgi:hypothetical protein